MSRTDQKKIKVLGAFSSYLNSTQLEVIIPCIDLQNEGKIQFQCTSSRHFDPKLIQWTDIVLCSRSTAPHEIPFFNEVIRQKKPLIYQCDDNFFHIPTDTPVGRYHRHPATIHTHIKLLETADLVRCYSSEMNKSLSKINSNVEQTTAYFDNRMCTEEKKKNEKIRIVYASSRSQGDHLQNIFTPSLKKILTEYPSTVEMFFWGPPPEDKSLLKLNNCSHLNFESNYDNFIKKFKAMNFDIGLAPMLSGTFFNSKTNNKYREYGGCKIAGIYSDTGLYSSVNHEKTGLLVPNNYDSWYSAIKKLLDNCELRECIVNNAHEDVLKNYSLRQFKDSLFRGLESTVLTHSQQQKKLIGFPRAIFIFQDEYFATHPDYSNLVNNLDNTLSTMGCTVTRSKKIFSYCGQDSLAIVFSNNTDFSIDIFNLSKAKESQFIAFTENKTHLPDHIISQTFLCGTNKDISPQHSLFDYFENNSISHILSKISQSIVLNEANLTKKTKIIKLLRAASPYLRKAFSLLSLPKKAFYKIKRATLNSDKQESLIIKKINKGKFP